MSKFSTRWGAVAALLFMSSTAHAHLPHVCPDGIVDEPNIDLNVLGLPDSPLGSHVEHDDLINWSLSSEQLFLVGGALAEVNFNACDGQGRPATTGNGQKRSPAGQFNFLRTSGPEANSCAGCHAQPRAGGAGDFVANTFNGTEALDPVTFSIDPSLSNERNTTGMFGAGFIEIMAQEMTTELWAQRDEYAAINFTGHATLKAKGVKFKVKFKNGKVVKAEGIDTDLVVKPFGAGGTTATIRQFTVEAFNRHHGMQAEERYDLYLGDPDFDEDGIERELTVGDITTVTLWQAMLDRPLQELPDTDEGVQRVLEGTELFAEVGCASCHLQEVKLQSRKFCTPSPYEKEEFFHDTSKSLCVYLNYNIEDPDKTDSRSYGGELQPKVPPDEPFVIFPLTDLKRHRMCDDAATVQAPVRTLCNEQHNEGRPDVDGVPGYEFFLTADLWQLGESAPYGHNGHFAGLSEIITAHGGEARASRDAYIALPVDSQLKVIEYLKSLKLKDQPIRLFDG